MQMQYIAEIVTSLLEIVVWAAVILSLTGLVVDIVKRMLALVKRREK